ncbi:MAG: alpha/beta hydrolase, partial [Leptospiraceae bacterium]|nr:alpha/beta hydrolase [Leptospiraceae bacterium]
VRRYATKSYYGELDDIDAYQIYSLFSNKEDWFSVLLGDGIIEKPSLEYLKEEVFLKKENPNLRSILVDSHNHFSILDSAELKEWLRNVLL